MNSPENTTPRIAVLVSGGGRSLVNLCEKIEAGELDCEVALVLADREGIRALEHAADRGIDGAVVKRKAFEDTESFSRAVFAEIEQRGCEFVVLAGYLKLILIPEHWLGRAINIHPALLPAFGGAGYYGDRVHQAVLEAGVSETGCTVHYVTNEYDAGPILLQRRIEVTPSTDTHDLAERVFEEEKIALPEAVRRHLAGEVFWRDGQAICR